MGLGATLGRRLPHSLRIYGFGARLGGAEVLAEIRQLARLSEPCWSILSGIEVQIHQQDALR